MFKNRISIVIIVTSLLLGAIPFAVEAATQKSSVYISAFYVGAPGEKPNQEYVKITNSGKIDVNLKGWKIIDSGKKHTYKFSSYTLKAKSTLTLKSGKGKNTASTLYWNKNSFIWNNHDSKNNGDTAYLYNNKGTLISSKRG